jgi:hypothetical protein
MSLSSDPNPSRYAPATQDNGQSMYEFYNNSLFFSYI